MNTAKTCVGIELGSTRIKAVLIDEHHSVLAVGSSDWENSLKDGIWTYGMDEVISGLQSCYSALKLDYKRRHSIPMPSPDALGISAMMHGYIALGMDDELLVPFRTWRNTMTGDAAEKLSELFDFNIPQRWTVAHLGEAMIRHEEHLRSLGRVFTLASYVHYLLTGKAVIGIGDASGMFPVDSSRLSYDERMMELFHSFSLSYGYDLRIDRLFPEVLTAGEPAGFLTEYGARLLDPSGELKAGIATVPPEGDAGTGMVATCSVRTGTGNVSAGTSDFAMVVLDHMPARHKELDLVTTPSGDAVAMVHCNNCTSDINYWIGLFGAFGDRCGLQLSPDKLFSLMYSAALEADGDPDSIVSCNYYSGEGVTGFDRGIPFVVHTPGVSPSLPDFMRCHIYSALATLKIGMDILKSENIKIDRMLGHGGFFKSSEAGQRFLSAAIGAPVSVMENAGEGGPYGMALLAAYSLWNKGESLADYLDLRVFRECRTSTVMASSDEIDDFDLFIVKYKKMLEVERKALEVL